MSDPLTQAPPYVIALRDALVRAIYDYKEANPGVMGADAKAAVFVAAASIVAMTIEACEDQAGARKFFDHALEQHVAGYTIEASATAPTSTTVQ
jgi:hypothetical protein